MFEAPKATVGLYRIGIGFKPLGEMLYGARITASGLHGVLFRVLQQAEPAEAIQAIKAPTLIIIGDSDLARPESAVEMFRLLGGGVFGDMPPGLPASQLAILPGTSHVMAAERTELLLAIIPPFLDAPMPEDS